MSLWNSNGGERGGSLSTLRVLDLSRILGGPYCTQILGDHGADVLKIEPPSGDDTRTWGPPFVDGVSAYFLGVNRNKRGMVLDLASSAGREMLLHLLLDADVLVENFKAGTLERWGLGYEQTLADRFPRLIHCCISGFGRDGPLGGLPGYDAAAQATAGLMSVNGEENGPPLRIGVPIVDMVTGLNAAIGILLALQERSRSGRGQYVEATLFDSALSILHPHVANYLAQPEQPPRTGNAHPNITPYDMFATATVPIFLAVGNDRQFKKLCMYLGKPNLAEDARYSSNPARNANRDQLKAELAAAFESEDGQQLADGLMKSGVPCAPVLGLGELVEHPHTAHREMLVRMEGYAGVASPIKLSRTPAQYRITPTSLTRAADTGPSKIPEDEPSP